MKKDGADRGGARRNKCRMYVNLRNMISNGKYIIRVRICTMITQEDAGMLYTFAATKMSLPPPAGHPFRASRAHKMYILYVHRPGTAPLGIFVKS